MFVYNLLYIYISANPSLRPQKLTQNRSKVISKFPQSESNLGSLEFKGYLNMLIKNPSYSSLRSKALIEDASCPRLSLR
jgi:hypothetical protein